MTRKRYVCLSHPVAVLQSNVGLVSDCCVYVEGKGSILDGLLHISVAKIPFCQRHEVSLFDMSNNKISYYTDFIQIEHMTLSKCQRIRQNVFESFLKV